VNCKFDGAALLGLTVGGGSRIVEPSDAEAADKVSKDGCEIVDLVLRSFIWIGANLIDRTIPFDRNAL
jgi:hypothetical protein